MVLTFLVSFMSCFLHLSASIHFIDLLIFLSVRFQPSRTSHRFKFSQTYAKYYLRC